MAAGGVPQFASLYVGDLHADVTEAMLYEIFNSVGPVASIRVCRDSVSRRSLGYGYVNFHAVSDAERALDTLNYSSIKGRACRIMWSQRDPSLRKSGLGNVYVKNLDRNIDNKALYDTFSLFGNILSCKVACESSGKSRGYGFVHYETEEAAKQAIERVNGMQIGDKTVQVTGFQKRNERDKPEITNYTNLYVKNFPNDWDESKINELFGTFGSITSVAVMEDPKGRKFAFVNFEATEGAKQAVEELNNKDMRSDAEKEKDKEEKEEEEENIENPSYLLYVSRAQSKSERKLELRDKFGVPESGPGPRAQGINLYVKNLDENIDDESLKELFTPFGTITSARAMSDGKGKCKGFGFVCFGSPDEATKAVTEMHLKVVKGKPLYVGLAEKKEAREERLRQRYTPGGGGMDEGFGKGSGYKGMMGKDGKGKMSGKPGLGGGMGGGIGGMGGAMGGGVGAGMGGMPQMGMYPGMGPQGMMGGPQMMGQMGKGGPMMGGPGMMPGKGGPMMGGPQMMGPMGKGGPMMGGPQMMGQMGKGGPMMGSPQMMAAMGKGGPMPGMPGKGMPGMPGGVPGMMGPGMMRPQMPMPGGPMGAPRPAQQAPPQQALAQPQPGAALNASTLAAAPPAVQKQMLGEKLFPAISKYQPELAGKITGMMLEMDNSELLMLLESEPQLKVKVDEAMRVLESQRA